MPNETPMVGLYQPNSEELKVVEWIMGTFIRVTSYQVTLQEIEARKIVTEIIKQSPKLRGAIIERTKSVRSTLDLLHGQLQQLDCRIAKHHVDRAALDKRIDFLLSTGESTEAETFRREYVETVNRIKEEIEKCQRQKATIERGRADLQDDELNSSSLIARAEKIQAIIQERDPVALKNAFKALFSTIEVGELDRNGRRQLQFKIMGSENFAGVGNRRNKSSIEIEMAPGEGIEPPTRWLTATCSTS